MIRGKDRAFLPTLQDAQVLAGKENIRVGLFAILRADILEIMMQIVLRFVETRIIRRDKENADNYPGNYGKHGQDEKNLEHH